MDIGRELKDAIAADARLQILRELKRQVDGRLSVLLLQKVLDIYGIRRDRDWVTTQLRKLEQLDAVELQDAGTMIVAKITRTGRDHLEERGVIEGVTRPVEAD